MYMNPSETEWFNSQIKFYKFSIYCESGTNFCCTILPTIRRNNCTGHENTLQAFPTTLTKSRFCGLAHYRSQPFKLYVYLVLKLISYINTGTVCACVPVSLSPARSRERNAISPRFFRRRKEILLVSCTNCFSSLYDAWFERKSVSTGYALESVHARYTFRLPWAG